MNEKKIYCIKITPFIMMYIFVETIPLLVDKFRSEKGVWIAEEFGSK